MSVNVSFINMKGGVGKTSLAMQAAIYGAWNKKRVLAIDLDPQSNLSQALLGPPEYVKFIKAAKPTVVTLLEDYQPATSGTGGPQPITIQDVIIKNVWSRSVCLHLLPCRLELSRVLRIALPSATGAASRRIAGLGRTKSRGHFVFCRHARARSARTGNAVTVRAARGAQRRDPCRMGHLCRLPTLGAAGFIRSRQFSTVGTKR